MIEIVSRRALRGPNVWASCPVLELTVRLERPDSPDYSDRLAGWRASQAGPAGLLAGLALDAGPVATLARLMLDLQTVAGSRVGFGATEAADTLGQYRIATEYTEIAVGLACCDQARDLLAAVLAGTDCDLGAAVTRLRALGQDVHLGPSTAAIARAARARDIPVQRLGRNSLLLLGQGARQRRVWTAETDRTGAIAEAIAQDKELTRALLAAVGVPAPQGRPVTSADEAWATAETLGLPVVIKPRFGNHGRGISANLHTRERVEQAFAAALEESDDILCERHIQGADHRLLVVGERVVAAALREPAQVTGDGTTSVAGLVERVNADPRRSDGHATVLSRIKLDAIGLAVLAEQGYGPESIPAAGAKVLLRTTANLSTGGTACDVTDRVHPQVAARAVDAARVVGLDIAGVDILAQDIGLPLEAQGGAIVEVNAGPGLRMHLEPSAGSPQPVGEAIVELLFPLGQDGRIPIIAATGCGATAVTALIERILRHHRARHRETRHHGIGVALSNASGRYLDGRRVGDAERGEADVPCPVFINPDVEVAVLEVQVDEMVRAGLGFDRCRVAVATGPVAGDRQDADRALACLLGTVAATGAAVLDIEAPGAVDLAASSAASVVWFARDRAHPLIQKQLALGSRVVAEEDGLIVLAEGAAEATLLPMGGLTGTGKGTDDPGEYLAAAAAAWAFGLDPTSIREALDACRDCASRPAD